MQLPAVLQACRPQEELPAQAQGPSAASKARDSQVEASCLARTQELRDSAITSDQFITHPIVTAPSGYNIPHTGAISGALMATSTATAVFSRLGLARAATVASAAQPLALQDKRRLARGQPLWEDPVRLALAVQDRSAQLDASDVVVTVQRLRLRLV